MNKCKNCKYYSQCRVNTKSKENGRPFLYKVTCGQKPKRNDIICDSFKKKRFLDYIKTMFKN